MRSSALLLFSSFAVCLASALLTGVAQGTTAVVPQVQVTFYSSGSFLKSAMPGYKYGKFSGRIMDEKGQLAMLTPGHFITFNLDPGQHILSANSWMIPSPEAGGHLKIDLVSGRHYYIGTYLEPLFVASKFRIEQRTCQEAQQDNKSAKPLEQKHIKEYGLARVVVESSFPTCP